MTGVRNCHMKNMKISVAMKPYCSKTSLNLPNQLGNTFISIFEPSSGGNGIRLKKASTMFVSAVKASIETVASGRSCPKNLIVRTAMRAIRILLSGPANATQTSPQRQDLRL